jgi:hypothetical protein
MMPTAEIGNFLAVNYDVGHFVSPVFLSLIVLPDTKG